MVTIKDNRKKEHKFEELNIGEYFVYNGDLYVVTAETVETDNICEDYYESDIMNALDLKNGFLCRIGDNAIVSIVDVELTIS